MSLQSAYRLFFVLGPIIAVNLNATKEFLLQNGAKKTMTALCSSLANFVS